METDNSILREQLRQQGRKQEKQRRSQQMKREKYFKSLNKKKKNDIITADEYKKLGDNSATRKAYSNLKRWCHIYIKARDLYIEDGKIKGKCIACGRRWDVEFWFNNTIKNPDLWCASHYFLADQYSSVEFDEANLNLSCYNCNRNLSGNLALYKINLVKKIGDKEFEALENRKNNAHKFNILEMVKLKERFMEKAKNEIKRLGIKL